MPFVTVNPKVKLIVRGVPGPPGDISVPISSITFDTANPDLPTTIAQLTWDPEDDTLQFKQNGTTLQIGQEQQWPVVDKSGDPILNGIPVMASGTTGATGRINIALMDGTDTVNAKRFLGLTTEDIADQSNGKVSTFGKVRDIQTNGGQYGETWLDGQIIYISPTTIGALTNIEPSAGQLKMPCAFVINAHVSNGVLAARVTPIDEGLSPTKDEKAAMTGASSPNSSNVFATIADLGGGGGAIDLVANFTTVGGETSITFGSLTGKAYRIEIDSFTAATVNGNVEMLINGDANDTGYQNFRSVSAGSPAMRNNDALIGILNTSLLSTRFDFDIRADGTLHWSGRFRSNSGTAGTWYDYYMDNQGVYTTISEIKINITTSFDAGVVFRLFEIQEAV